MGIAAMHRSQHSRQHGAVADAGVEQAQRWGPGMDAGKFQRHPFRDHPLFAASMDEQQVFLAVLEKPEIASGIAFFGWNLKTVRRRQPARRRGRDIGLDAVQRIDGDAFALAQAMHQLAVIDGAAAKGRFGHVGLAAEFGDLAQNLVVFHRTGNLGRLGGQPRVTGGVLPSSAHPWNARLEPFGRRPQQIHSMGSDLMRRSILTFAFVAAATLCSAPSFAQSRSQLGPLCTSEATPADQQIDACNKIVALKAFSGEQLATVYFWRAVGWNKKGDYARVIADTTEALRLKPNQALYNMRGSAYYDKGEYDIAIAGFNDALRIGPTSGIIFHNRGIALRSKGDLAHAIADYDEAIRLNPKDAYSYQNRGSAKQALGDLDGALADINQAIRLNPALPSPLINRTVIWRAKGDYDRAIADATEAIGLANAKTPVNIMTPPGSVLISAYLHRALAYEAKGDFEHAKPDFDATLAGAASDAGSKANQATAKVRLSLLSDPVEAAPQPPRTPPPASSGEPQTATATAGPPLGSAIGFWLPLFYRVFT